MRKIKKIILVIERNILGVLEKINLPRYKELYPKYLRKIGVDIPEDYRTKFGGRGYIHPSAHFDGIDYSKIHIGANTVISKDVLLLTHDASISKGLTKFDKGARGGLFLKDIRIGENSFVGARSVILGGTTIGNNVIIGAGAVVKGTIPDNAIVVGNPAKIVGDIDEFTARHIELMDYEQFDDN